jgi:uncharacterized membrane protein
MQPRRRLMLDEPRRRVWLGTIELIVALVVVLALVALAVWFFFFAHNPLVH